jgi:hypothetical protein
VKGWEGILVPFVGILLLGVHEYGSTSSKAYFYQLWNILCLSSMAISSRIESQRLGLQ